MLDSSDDQVLKNIAKTLDYVEKGVLTNRECVNHVLTLLGRADAFGLARQVLDLLPADVLAELATVLAELRQSDGRRRIFLLRSGPLPQEEREELERSDQQACRRLVESFASAMRNQ